MSVSKLEIKESTIPNAGRGVFAKVDISSDESPCYYDGYSKPKKCSLEEESYLLCNKIVGYKTPKTDTGVAQIINDCSTIDLTEFPKNENLLARVVFIFTEIKRYLTCAQNQCNIVHNGANDGWKFYVYRKIKAGEELFFSYDVYYWLKQNYMKYKNEKCFTEAIVISLLFWNKISKNIPDVNENTAEKNVKKCYDYMLEKVSIELNTSFAKPFKNIQNVDLEEFEKNLINISE